MALSFPSSLQQNVADDVTDKPLINTNDLSLVDRKPAGTKPDFVTSTPEQVVQNEARVDDSMERAFLPAVAARIHKTAPKPETAAIKAADSELIKSIQLQIEPVDSSMEVVVKELKEEDLAQELSIPTVVKQQQVEPETLQQFKNDTLVPASSPRLSSANSPVADEPVMPVSHEQIVAQVRDKFAEHNFTKDTGQVTFRLHPAELGELKVSISMNEQQHLRVEIVAENKTVKDALLENIGSLKEALSRQNMEMKQFDVSTGSRQFMNQGFREGRQQEQQQYALPRQGNWLTGRTDDQRQSTTGGWLPRNDALLDMMM